MSEDALHARESPAIASPVNEPAASVAPDPDPTLSVPPVPADGPPVPVAPPTAAPRPRSRLRPIGPPPAGDDAPPLTASGHPNPHGLPEIAVERPETAVGAAFAGGIVLALILKRLGR